jgi:hypothetical protein
MDKETAFLTVLFTGFSVGILWLFIAGVLLATIDFVRRLIG